MNHVIQINFQTESGATLAGELVNPYTLFESVHSLSGVAVAIDQISEDEIDVLVFEGEEMQAHRVDVSLIVSANEVLV